MNKSNAIALRFVIMLSLVSLCSDIVYEGARSISGPFLGELGASALVVAAVAGCGELLGYGLRIASGYISDQTKKYWAITFLGYFINLMAVPLLAFAHQWPVAAALLVAERSGKALRTPARDTMLSSAATRIGAGFTFGLHQALDQIGAVLGPLIIAFAIAVRHDVRFGFLVLICPAMVALLLLLLAWFTYPNPEALAKETESASSGINQSLWLYFAATSLLAAGYLDFPLIAYYFKQSSLLPETMIPIFYSLAMAVDAVAGLVLGRLFDRQGMKLMMVLCLLSTAIAPAIFLSQSIAWCLFGITLWGACLGAQESLMKAQIVHMVARDGRGKAYGWFGFTYGLAWFAGSLVVGILYQHSLLHLVIFVSSCQILAFSALAFCSTYLKPKTN